MPLFPSECALYVVVSRFKYSRFRGEGRTWALVAKHRFAARQWGHCRWDTANNGDSVPLVIGLTHSSLPGLTRQSINEEKIALGFVWVSPDECFGWTMNRVNEAKTLTTRPSPPIPPRAPRKDKRFLDPALLELWRPSVAAAVEMGQG